MPRRLSAAFRAPLAERNHQPFVSGADPVLHRLIGDAAEVPILKALLRISDAVLSSDYVLLRSWPAKSLAAERHRRLSDPQRDVLIIDESGNRGSGFGCTVRLHGRFDWQPPQAGPPMRMLRTSIPRSQGSSGALTCLR